MTMMTQKSRLRSQFYCLIWNCIMILILTVSPFNFLMSPLVTPVAFTLIPLSLTMVIFNHKILSELLTRFSTLKKNCGGYTVALSLLAALSRTALTVSALSLPTRGAPPAAHLLLSPSLNASPLPYKCFMLLLHLQLLSCNNPAYFPPAKGIIW